MISSVGDFGQAYSEYLKTTIELKKLKVECDKCLAQIDFEKDKINAIREYELAKIEERKHFLEITMNATITELQQVHAERMEYLSIYKILTDALTNSNLDIDRIIICREAMPEIQTLMTESGKRGNEQLTIIHESARKLLEAIPSAQNLIMLPSNEN